MPHADAIALLARAKVVHLATSSGDGVPILRTVHGVVLGDALYFHGAPAGEKLEALGRTAVVSAEELVAEIPSWFVDPERACPATTYYESVQVHGVLEEEREPARKAAALQALMEKLQPEGRYTPISAEHPLYRNAVSGILIVRVSLERLDGKRKLGQNRKPEELTQLLELLWRRGHPGDPRAIERIRAANPAAPPPAFLAAPAGVRLHCALMDDEAPAVAALLEGAYWNRGVTAQAIQRAHREASAWVGARNPGGRLIASGRALSDGSKHAWIYDVIVHPEWRGRGLGQALVALLLDHPKVRDARKVRLATRDAQALYARFGFGTFEGEHEELILTR
jgi:nitroimidazol reductase NimA-like FMN-containing flavoprotein (pyridoxamine 5'-phosphate oxidase superfamily)/ribosomal protein S18 acetylase RimI-like enzyme